MRMPIPSVTTTPMPNRPVMNSQSAAGPDSLAKTSWRILPSVAKFRKPTVGEPQLTHASARSVAKPGPKALC